jgi:hypothetical protein
MSSEEDQVAWHGLLSARKPPRRPELVHRVAREAHALLGEHLLGETGAIEPECGPSTPVIGDPEQADDSLQERGLLTPAGQGSDRHPAPAPVRKLDTTMGAAAAPGDDPAVQEQRAHQRPPPGSGPRFGHRNGHPGSRLLLPGPGASGWDADESPTTDPTTVAIRQALDPPPLSAETPAQDPHDLSQQELAGKLGPVLGPAPHVQRCQRDDRVCETAHSRVRLTLCENLSAMRMISSLQWKAAPLHFEEPPRPTSQPALIRDGTLA